MIIKIVAEIKRQSVYTYALCGKKELGDPESLTFRGSSVDELTYFINNMRQTSKYMPVGWYYNFTYTCECRKKKAHL